jgi:hypothetical protein
MPIAVKSPDLTALARRLGAVSKDAPKAFAQATVSVSRASKTETKRAANEVYAAAQGRIADGISVSGTSGTVTIRTRKKPLTLRAFGARQTRRGVVVTVIRSRGRKLIKGGFSPAKFGGVPFKRLGRSQYPIAPLTGPSVADMLDNPKVYTPLQARLIERGRSELNRRLLRELGARG